MASTQRTSVEIVDVGGSFQRFIQQAPILAKKLMSTAVFITVSAVGRTMESNAPSGPDGEGLTPDAHLKFDIEDNYKAPKLTALVGILGKGKFGGADNLQAHVALFNEYAPNGQPFMRPAASVHHATFYKAAIEALRSLEHKLEDGVRD